jgi:hypothetical protein
MIDVIAPIYRKLIYEYLDVYDLSNISKICKKFNQDNERKEMLVKKISELFGYHVHQYFWKDNDTYDYCSIPQDILEHLLIEYKKKILSLSLKEVEDMSFEKKRYLIIHAPIDLFLCLDFDSQKKIIQNLCGIIGDSIRYANQKDMNIYIYEYRSDNKFDLYWLVNDIKCTLELIFKSSNDKVRYELILQIIYIRTSVDLEYPKSNTYFLEEEFISYFYIYGIQEIEKIIEIGIFFQKYFPKYLKDFLHNNIGYYIVTIEREGDVTNDRYANDVEMILDQNNLIYSDKTNAEVLDKLLLDCKLFSVELFRESNRKRWIRYCNKKK